MQAAQVLNYRLQPAGDVHVHEDAFVRVAWGRLPFADGGVRVCGGRVRLLGPAPWIGIRGKREIERGWWMGELQMVIVVLAADAVC
jgi:hypothetical protein